MGKGTLICYGCHGRYAAKPERFPKMVFQWREVKEIKDGKEKKFMKNFMIGYLCWKCVRKGLKTQLVPKVRAALKLGRNVVVTKHHIRDFFKLRDSGGLVIPEKVGDDNVKE